MGINISTSPNPEEYDQYDEDDESLVVLGEEILQRSYSGFGMWRTALAEAAGIGTKEGSFGPDPAVDYDAFELCNYQGEWAEGTEPEDPLYLLFIHSDCDGILEHKHLERLADRLEEILPNLLDDETYYPISHHAVTARFIAGLRGAYDLGHGLVFS